jgi:hypothetical protein
MSNKIKPGYVAAINCGMDLRILTTKRKSILLSKNSFFHIITKNFNHPLNFFQGRLNVFLEAVQETCVSLQLSLDHALKVPS